MPYNSAIFIIVFSLFMALYSLSGVKISARKWLLFLFNVLFYFLISKWGIVFLLLLGFADYAIARKIHSSKSQKLRSALLILSLVYNISLILTFRHLTDWFHLNDYEYWPALIGVSFFVFRSISYVLDVYRETMDEPESDLIAYLTWLSFFPLILAGPISPAREFLPQLKMPYNGSQVPLTRALFLLSSGIIKKYILSNYLAANFVNRVFEGPSYFTGLENSMATISQALVVYLDFSGYTDMMVALSLLLGFSIRENFNFPYAAGNITEYWRRWHMSLSQWLNEYLFFPLSFSLRKLKKTGMVLSVMITFAISGFWHGTAVQYTVWGLLHGIALSWDILSFNIRAKARKIVPKSIYGSVSIIFTFIFLCLSGIFFKAPSIALAYEVFRKIFTETQLSFFMPWLGFYPWIFTIICVVLIWQWSVFKKYDIWLNAISNINPLIMSLVLAVVIFAAYQVTGLTALPFIYLDY